jgi:hypothetical protein
MIINISNNNNTICLLNLFNTNNVKPFNPHWSPIETITNNPFSDEPIITKNIFWNLLKGFSIRENSTIKTIVLILLLNKLFQWMFRSSYLGLKIV